MALPRFSNTFKNITISYKLIGGFGIILLLFLGAALIIGYSGRSTVTSFESLIAKEIAIASHAANIETLMLQSRRNEKDFILRKNKKYPEALEKNIVRLKNEAEIIIDLSKTSGYPIIEEQASLIIQSANSYAASFRELVVSYEKKGLDHNSGLQGKLRNTVHELEAKAKAHQLEDVYLALLQMRGFEKDYIRTWSGKYKPRLNESMIRFKEIIKTINNDSVKIIQDGFNEYEKGFQRYFQADENIRPIIYEEIRSSARDIQTGLTGIYVSDAYSLTLAIRRSEKDYLLRHDDKYVKLTHTALDDLEIAFMNSAVLTEHKENNSRLISNYRDDFQALVREDKIIKNITARMRNVVHKIEPLVAKLKENALRSAETKIDTTGASAFSILNIVVGIALAVVIFGIFLSLLITRGITRPLTKAVAFSEKMSKGDLTQTLNVTGKDEIGVLASALNTMSASLAHKIGKIALDANSLTVASEELFHISSTMSTGSSDLSEKSNSVSTATEEMNSRMISVAAASEAATTNLNILTTATGEMTSTIHEIAESAENAKNATDQAVLQVKSATGKINKLGDAAHDINMVTETIDEISEQTNLLALNATIEAARAGDAGKGFAVVASEIKELARQTAEATRNIKERIEGIQNTTSSTVEEIRLISGVIKHVNEIVSTIGSAVEEQSATTREIADNIVNSSQGIHEINDSISQTSESTGNIYEDISGVSLFAGEVSENSAHMSANAENLSRLAISLKSLIGEFKTPPLIDDM